MGVLVGSLWLDFIVSGLEDMNAYVVLPWVAATLKDEIPDEAWHIMCEYVHGFLRNFGEQKPWDTCGADRKEYFAARS